MTTELETKDTPAVKALKTLKDKILKDREAIGTIKGDGEASAKALQIGLDDATAVRRMQLIAFDTGRAAAMLPKPPNMPPSITAAFNVFNSKMRSPESGRKVEIAESTLKGMASFYQSFTDLGFLSKAVKDGPTHDDLFVWVATNSGKLGEYSKRGKFVRKIAEMATIPSWDEADKFLASELPVPELETISASFEKAAKKIYSKHPTIKAALDADGPRRKAYGKLVAAAKAFAAACKDAEDAGDDDGLAAILADAAD